MSVLRSTAPTTPATQIVGYANRRTGEIFCLEHGHQHIDSPRSPWAAVRLADNGQAGYASPVPVICQECGAWLNDESTGYAMVSLDDNWRRRLRRARGHLDG